MAAVFIIQNHDHTYLTKHGEWVDGSDASQLFRSLHKDEAVNMKVEQSVRNPALRLSILDAQLNEKGQVQLNQPPTGSNIDSAPEVLFNDNEHESVNREPPLTTGSSETAV